jgi:hypothetical protein
VVVSASTPAFAPSDRPRVAVAADGTLAAIQEPSRITVVEIPSCVQFAELGTDPNAVASEVAWVGTPPRLLVLSRFESHSTVHLVDPFGPRSLAEIRLDSPMRLYAAVGSFALAIGSAGTATLAATDKSLTLYQFPARAVPSCAGASGTQFVVALPGVIEEWDPQSRMPKRRLKLPRPATVTAVGGSDRVVWLTTQQEPARIDVIPLVNRGQPKAHDLPEPIATVASHPRSDVIACIGATSGRVYVVDLDGRTGLRVVGPQGIDRTQAVALVLGRVTGVLAAEAKHAITVVLLDRGDQSDSAAPAGPTSARRSSLFGATDDGDDVLTAVTLASPPPEGRAARPASPPPLGNLVPASTKLQPTSPRPGSTNDKLQSPTSSPDSASRTALAGAALQSPAGSFDGASRTASASGTLQPTGPLDGTPRSASTLATAPTGSGPLSSASSLDVGAAPPVRPAGAPSRASQAGFDETVAPPMSTQPAASSPLFASPSSSTRPSQSVAAPPPSPATRPSQTFAAPAPSPPPPTSSSDARAIDDTVPPVFSAAPSSPSAALCVPPPRGADARRGVAATIPVSFAADGDGREQLTAFRDRVEHPRARTDEPVAALWTDMAATWRDELVAWTRSVDARQAAGIQGAGPLEQLASRYDTSFELVPALAWLYGQHLLGRDGAAPADLAQLPRAGWDEALGRGELARSAFVTLRGSRVRLSEVVYQVLDGRAPLSGTLVGTPGVVSLLGPCVIVAAGPLRIIAEACLASIGGAILAANTDVDPAELAAEARAYGAAPLWRVRADHLSRIVGDQPIILVADDDLTADLLGVPRLT